MGARDVKRVVLVQRRLGDAVGGRPVRRFSLARVGPTTVSALGADRFERMEEVAGMDSDAAGSPNGMPKPPRKRPEPDLERVREALGKPGERPGGGVTPRPDDPEQQREARERLDQDVDAREGG